ncbi:MAG: acyl-CoA dehydratase activase [Bacteroidales bacterium]|jgi:predicted CoA-substrate-specific enzyme activase|nr:acyl-CoA dehydratase activase [Bacteroidales bacterium]
MYRIGLDVGSTTAKAAIIDDQSRMVYTHYMRHNTLIYETVSAILTDALPIVGENPVTITITGSAGMGICESTGIPFIQELIAATEVVQQMYPQVHTLIDIGGEDSKMIFFPENRMPDIRMNGSCAGGTGAFIDQMASLLNIETAEMSSLAACHQQIYPIASRCGVFAKTDVQNLISRKIPKEDIAASVFHAVAVQSINTLARGYDVQPQVMFIGGPFTFLPELTTSFVRTLGITPEELVKPEHPEVIPALGAALSNKGENIFSMPQLIDLIAEQPNRNRIIATNRLDPLFTSDKEWKLWQEETTPVKVKRTALSEYQGTNCFLGIDSGSTTTKIVALGEDLELLFGFYRNNEGQPMETVHAGLTEFKKELAACGKNLIINRSLVTGYGEELIKAAYGLDNGVVETIAHYAGARHINPDVSFILDIGGQDMKAIFIRDGSIQRIELNESCSSGCGSFIETFGKNLGMPVEEFACKACSAKAPCDLGTRCTVFMNSKVKQSLRENASLEDIAAGLSYSVIKNALIKVLNVTNMDDLGDHISVQGGTFRNPSVRRALELLSGRSVTMSDIPELMGAYGAAVIAKKQWQKAGSTQMSRLQLDQIDQLTEFQSKQLRCKGCENQCVVTRFKFQSGNAYYSGNKCEKVFTNKGNAAVPGFNLYQYKNELLNKCVRKPSGTPRHVIGIPRVLNMFENLPFWSTLLRKCGMEVVLSSPSTVMMYEKGLGTIMSDSICFPAKLVHGHIYDLAERKVERIFYPMVIFERFESKGAVNAYNCPIVSSYAEVIRSSVNPEARWGIPMDSPVVSFADEHLLERACYRYLRMLGVDKQTFRKAFQYAQRAQANHKQKLLDQAKEVIRKATEENRTLIVLAGRPYHTDSLINSKVPDMLCEMGADVLSEDAVSELTSLPELQVLSQWTYPNRIYQAAAWVGQQPENVQLVQINSFGCGPDAITINETKELLRSKGKTHTLVRVDEITSTGSLRLRLRSMLESFTLRNVAESTLAKERTQVAFFEEKDKHRTILAPGFSHIYSRMLPPIFALGGFKLVNLPPPDKMSVDAGLKYANNEICYPATIVVGDIIKALQSGKYDRDQVAIGITQTGGQCRASTYLSLIKKALIASGFEDVPVIAIGTEGKVINSQPGFDMNWLKLLPTIFAALCYTDSIATMYYSSVAREVNKGSSDHLLDKYLRVIQPKILRKDINGIYALLKRAVAEFNRIETDQRYHPRIGIVGEIYIKYNAFGNSDMVDWLVGQGVEVVVPPLIDFFLQSFVNIEVNTQQKIRRSSWSDMFVYFLEKYANGFVGRTNRVMSKYVRYEPSHSIRDMSEKASEILNLANQFGEGWLIPGEIAAFAGSGVNNVVSVQPFGCIANHVVSKGVEKRIRDRYPDMNLLFLDFDSGMSEVNVLNRLHFMVKNVTDEKQYQTTEDKNIIKANTLLKADKLGVS